MKKIKATYEQLEWLYAPREEYYDYDGIKRYLGLFFPFKREWETDERFPLVVFVPGAMWRRQELYNDVPKFTKLAERGVALATVMVRESEIAPFPAQMYDMHRAVTWLMENAERFHIDTNRIFLAGNSSGGHIALMTAFTKAHNLYWPEDAKPYEIKGVIGQSSSSDIGICLKDPWPSDWGKRPSASLLGVETDEEILSLEASVSCRTYVTEDVKLPPVLLFHHGNDPIVSADCSRTLSAKLEACGQSVEYYELDGADHCGNGMWSDEVLDITMQFIQSH